MESNEILALIRQQNEGRDPILVARKEELLAQNPFNFLRGTALLFWKRVAVSDIPSAPAIWGCADAHIQNFGTFKAANTRIYFDINDFDDACLLPASWEVLRMLVSLKLCGGNSVAFAQRWLKTLAWGKALWIEQDSAQGPVKDLINSRATRSRKDFLDNRTTKKGNKRKIIRDGKRALDARPDQVRTVSALIENSAWAAEKPDFYRVLDVARRLSGNGSFGIERYIVLVQGKGSPDNNHLLDLKRALPSNAAQFSPCIQPPWPAENLRIVTLQERLQAVPPAHLHALTLEGHPFVLKALQPSEDKIAWNSESNAPVGKEILLQNMADVLAWDSIRSAGHQGAATVEELGTWAERSGVAESLETAAQKLERDVRNDWNVFVTQFRTTNAVR